MPKTHKNIQRERYLKAKKELGIARESMEHKEDPLHDKIYRINSVKKAKDFFEERWRRLSNLLQKAKKLGNKKRIKTIEKEMAYEEENIKVLDNRREVLAKEIEEELHKGKH